MQFFAYMTAKRIPVNDLGMPIGEGHWRAKLTDNDVSLVFELRALGLTQRAIAAKFDDIPGGLSREAVRDILSGRVRGQVPSAYRPAKRR
jgi:hypothetical protein